MQIVITFVFGSDGNLVQGNFIGTDVTGTIGLGNLGDGLRIRSSNVIVGGSVPPAGNVIAFNLGDGVAVTPAIGVFPQNVGIRLNSLHSNGGLGIDINKELSALGME